MAPIISPVVSSISWLRRGRSAPTAVLNAWQAMADDASGRAERERLMPGRHAGGPGNQLDAIPVAQCWRLLERRSLGRIGFTAHSGQPLILPVNYTVADRRVFIRSGRGPKLEAARRGDLVAFEVDEIDLEDHTGWSVSLSGRARWIREPSELAGLRLPPAPPWAAGPRDEVIVIEAAHIGGRQMRAPTILEV